MHNPTMLKSFIAFMDSIKNEEFPWLVTGSFRMFLEGSQQISPRDIDIVTNMEGCKIIEKRFADRITHSIKRRHSGSLDSVFGCLQISGVRYDIMAQVFNKIDGKWINIPNCDRTEYILKAGARIPVLPLDEELRLAQLLNDKFKIDALKKLMNAAP